MEKKKKVASLASGSEQSGSEGSSKSGGKKAKLSLQRKGSGKTTLVIPEVDLNETEDFKDGGSFTKKAVVKGVRSKNEVKDALKRKERNKKVREGTDLETDKKNDSSKISRSRKERQIKLAGDDALGTNTEDVEFKTIKGDNSDEDCIDGKIYVRRTYGKGEARRIADDVEQGPGNTKTMSADSSNVVSELSGGNARKGKVQEQSKTGKSLTSRFGRAEKQKLQHCDSAMEIHQACDMTTKEVYDFHPATDGKKALGEVMIEQPPKIRQCPTCQRNLPRETFVEHLKDCLANFEKNIEETRKKVQQESKHKERQRIKQQEESAFGISLSEDHIGDSDYLCQICQTDLSPLDAVGRAEHVNNCIDQVEPKQTGPAPPPVRAAVPDCPMCGKPLKTEASRKVHLKKCARTLGVSTDQMMTAVKAQEKEIQQRAGPGRQGSVPAKKVTTTATRKKKTKLPTDEATQLAMALSSSLADEKHKREQALIGQLNLRGIGDIDKLSAPDGKKTRKKKGAAGAPPLLLQLTKEESHSRVAQRVTQYIESQSLEDEITPTPPFSRGSHLDDLPGTMMVDYTVVQEKCTEQLWSLTSLDDHTKPRSVYYTSALMPPVTMSRVPPGSKLRRLSQIPGRRRSEEEKKDDDEEKPTSDMEEENPSTPIIASTPTALILAELAGEDDAHSQPVSSGSSAQLSSCSREAADGVVTVGQNNSGNMESETADSAEKQDSRRTEPASSVSDGEVKNRRGNDMELSRGHMTKGRNTEKLSLSCDDPNLVNMETGVCVEEEDVLEQASGFCVEEIFEVKDDVSSQGLLHIQNDYLMLVDNPSHSDVTIETSDKCPIHAHQVILMLRCPALLELTEAGVISLPSSSPEAVLSLLKFVYAGKVQVQHSLLQEVHVLAGRFGVQELAQHCESALKERDAVADVESVEKAERERRESIDDMFKELLSDEDFHTETVAQEDVEKEEKENQSDDDEDDWREIYLSQRQQLHRTKSVEEEQMTSDKDMDVDDACGVLLQKEMDCDVSEHDSNSDVRDNGNSKREESSDISDEKKEEIHKRETFRTKSNMPTDKYHKLSADTSKKKNTDNGGRLNEEDYNQGTMSFGSRTRDRKHSREEMKRQRNSMELEDEEEEGDLDDEKMTCGEEELFPSEDELMSQELLLAVDSSEEEKGMEKRLNMDNVAGSQNQESKTKTGSLPGDVIEPSPLASSHGGSRKGQSKYQSELVTGGDLSSESGSKKEFDDFVIIKSGTTTSDDSVGSEPEGSKDLLPSIEESDESDTKNEPDKNQDSLDVSDDDVIDSSLPKASEPSKRKRTPSESDVINSPVFRKSSNSSETPKEKSARKRVKLGTPSTEQRRENTADANKMSTPVDRSSMATSRTSVVAEDSLYITPIPRERQRSTFMFTTPDSLTKNSIPTGAGDFVAIPVGRIVLTEDGKEGIVPLDKEEPGGSIKLPSQPAGVSSEREGKRAFEPDSYDSVDKDISKRKNEGKLLPGRVRAKQRHSDSDEGNGRNRGESLSVTDRLATDVRRSAEGDGYGDIRKKLLAQVRGQIAVLQSEEETSDRGDLKKDRPSDESDGDGDVSPLIPVTDISCLSESVPRPGVSHLSESGPVSVRDDGDKENSLLLKPAGCADDSDSDLEITSDNLQLVADLSNSASPRFKSISSLKKVSSEQTSRKLSLSASRSSTNPADAGFPKIGNSPTGHESPSAPGDVWEGFDDIDADYLHEPFCDADTEESPRKKGLEILGSAQKKKYTHRRRISLDESASRLSAVHVATPQGKNDDLPQGTNLEEEDMLPSPENAAQGEVTVEFEVPGGDSFLWHEDNAPAEEPDTEEGLEEEQSTVTNNFKTPVSRQPVKKSKKWVPPSPFTPMPNYDAMNTPQLKKAVTKYGVRPVGKKRMKIVLKDIYEQTHQYETDSDYDHNSPVKQIPANNRSDLAKKKSSKPSAKSSSAAAKPSSKPAAKSSAQATVSSAQASKSSGKVTKSSGKVTKSAGPITKPTVSSTRIGTGASSDTSASEDGSNHRSVSSSQESDRSDVPEESFLHVEEEEEDLSASQQVNQGDFHAKMLQFVRKRPDIHTRMMMYEPLELDWLKKEVQDSGIKCSTQKLMDFLDEKCLTFTMKNMTKRNANRRKPKKRRKIDVPEAAV